MLGDQHSTQQKPNWRWVALRLTQPTHLNIAVGSVLLSELSEDIIIRRSIY